MVAVSLLNAARFAQLAYSAPDVVTAAFMDRRGDADALACLENVATAPVFLNDCSTDLQAYACITKEQPRTLIVAVRGTNSIIDAFQAVSARMTPLPGAVMPQGAKASVHSGFLRQYMSLSRLLLPVLKDLNADEKPYDVLFTGHSLGAAVAALGALQAKTELDKKVSYIGFGSPHVGDAAFGEVFRGAIADPTLVKHGRDPITKVVRGLGYQHVTSQKCYGDFDPCPDLALLWQLPDHDIAKYVKAIEAGAETRAAGAWDRTARGALAWLMKMFT